MTQINIKITGATAIAEKTGILTSGMVGVPVRFTFDSEWADLEAIAVFSGSDEIISWPMLGEKATVVPWEVLKIPNTVLKIGVEGRLHDGTIVIPTIWATVGTVMPGANANDNLAQPPTPTPFDRIMSTIGEMSELTTEAKDSLVAAINEVQEGVESILTPEEVEEIAGAAAGKLVPEIDRKLDKPNTAPEVGKVLKVKSVNEDGTFTCEWADDSAGAVDDVRINGESIVTDGMATIPVATGDNNKFGLMRVQSNDGISVNSEGQLSVASALESNIDGRNSSRPIVPTNLDYAVRAAMCDGKGAAWTDEEQAAARDRMGLENTCELIETWTNDTEEPVNFVRTQTPDGTLYGYKHMLIRMIGTTAQADWKSILCYTDGFTIEDAVRLYAVAKEKSDIYMSVENGFVVMENHHIAIEGTAPHLGTAYYYEGQKIKKTVQPKAAEKIVKISIDGIPAGSTLYIWGTK